MLGALLCFGCETPAQVGAAPEPQAQAYPVSIPERGDAELEREYVCEVRAARRAEVRARVQGVIDAVAVDEGGAVRAGDLLFAVNARVLEQGVLAARASLRSAEAEREASRIERDSTRTLADKGVVSATELARADAGLRVLDAKIQQERAAVAQASSLLELAKLRAPFDGQLDRILHKAGSAVAEGELLTTISDAREVHAYFRMTEREFLEQSGGTIKELPRDVSLVLVDGTEHAERGVVDAVGTELDPETGSLTIRAKFPNPNGVLRHGSRGKVRVRITLPGALRIPQRATFDIQGNVHVYVVDADGVARMRKVVPRARLGEDFVLESGLAADERFVLEGVHRLKDGERVAVLDPSREATGG